MTRKPGTSRDQMPVYPDGLCRIYSVNESGTETTIINSLPLREKILGYGRVFTARSENVVINRVIRVSNCAGFDTHDYVEVINEGKYEIVMISTIFDSIPPEKEISLRQVEVFTK